MLLFLKLVDETQITATPEDTSHHNSRKLLVLLSLRAIRMLHFVMRYPVAQNDREKNCPLGSAIILYRYFSIEKQKFRKKGQK